MKMPAPDPSDRARKWHRRLRLNSRWLAQWWHDYHWWLILIVFVLAFFLGFIGFTNEYRDRNFQAISDKDPATKPAELSALALVYLALQLFTLESGSKFETTIVSPPLEIARLLAPLVTLV